MFELPCTFSTQLTQSQLISAWASSKKNCFGFFSFLTRKRDWRWERERENRKGDTERYVKRASRGKSIYRDWKAHITREGKLPRWSSCFTDQTGINGRVINPDKSVTASVWTELCESPVIAARATVQRFVRINAVLVVDAKIERAPTNLHWNDERGPQ